MPQSPEMMDLFLETDYWSINTLNTSLAVYQSLMLYLEMDSIYLIISEHLISKTKHKIAPPTT